MCTVLSFWYCILMWYIYKVQCFDCLLKMPDICFLRPCFSSECPCWDACIILWMLLFVLTQIFVSIRGGLFWIKETQKSVFAGDDMVSNQGRNPRQTSPHIMHAIVLSEGMMGCMEKLHDWFCLFCMLSISFVPLYACFRVGLSFSHPNSLSCNISRNILIIFKETGLSKTLAFLSTGNTDQNESLKSKT